VLVESHIGDDDGDATAARERFDGPGFAPLGRAVQVDPMLTPITSCLVSALEAIL
jgi:hypothetical protein